MTRRIILPNILAMIYTYISFFHFVSFLKNFPPPFSRLFVAMVKKTGYDSGLPSEIWNYTVLRTQTSLQIAHEAFYGIHEALILIKVKERSGKQIGLAERLEDTKAKTKWPFFLINSVLF